MNTADDLGDLEFTVRAKLLPIECSDPAYARHASYDCANPEQDATDLAITKLIIQVKKGKIGGYCPATCTRADTAAGPSTAVLATGSGPSPWAQFHSSRFRWS